MRPDLGPVLGEEDVTALKGRVHEAEEVSRSGEVGQGSVREGLSQLGGGGVGTGVAVGQGQERAFKQEAKSFMTPY